MVKISKTFALLLTLIIAMSYLTFLTAKPTNAQSLPLPSIPNFTVRFVNDSSTQNSLIEISIESQPFAYSNNGTLYQEYFNVRAKLHSAENWTEIYVYNGTSSFNGKGPTPVGTGNFSYAEYISPNAPIQSESGTIIDFYVIPEEFHLENGTVLEGYSVQYTFGIWGANPIGNRTSLEEIPIDGQLDFQVQAIVGHNSTVWYNISALWAGIGTYVPAVAYDLSSDWSNTQTIRIGSNLANAFSNSYCSESSWLAILPLPLSVPIVLIIIRKRLLSETISKI